MLSPKLIRTITACLAVCLIVACGGGGGGGTGGGGGGGGGGGNNGVTLNVNSASLAFGQTLNLTGTVPGVANQVILWSATGGSIAPTGPSSATYTAPQAAGTFTITGTADADHSKTGTCVVTVSQVGISIEPQSVTMAPGASVNFNATVVGSTNTGATFVASGGTVTSTGPHSARFTAPAGVGDFTITAKANANSGKTATANIRVANVGASSTVSGRVVVDGTQSGIPGVIIGFYNSSGSEVARATTNISGNFSGQVPISARRWHVIPTSLTASYYKQYTYAGIRYSALVPTCTVPLPTLTAGVPYNLPGLVQIPSTTEPPPPPPNGCG
jgi:hypothetical protein